MPHCYTAAMAIPTEAIGSIPRPIELIEAMQSLRLWPHQRRGAATSARRRPARHHPAPRTNRLANHHRWRTDQVQLRHLPPRRSPQSRARWRHPPLRRWPSASAASPHQRAVSLQHPRRHVHQGSSRIHRSAGQAGRYFRLCIEPALSGNRASRLLTRPVHRRPRRRSRSRHPQRSRRRCRPPCRSISPKDVSHSSSIHRGSLLRSFVELNNQVLDRFSAEDRPRIGVHVCPGGDHDSTHSADVDYAAFLPDLFQMKVGRFYLQMASEPDRKRMLQLISSLAQKDQRVFVGVIDPLDPAIETPDQVRDRVIEAAAFIAQDQLGTTDDCGFAPFADDVSTAREIAFKKISARVAGTALAAAELGW